MSILRPIFGRGVAQRRLGAEVPEFRQKFTVLLGAHVVPKAQIWNSKKICPGLDPPLTPFRGVQEITFACILVRRRPYYS